MGRIADFFGIKKRYLAYSEVEIIKRAYQEAAKGTFEVLYFDHNECIRFHFQAKTESSQKKALDEWAKIRVEDFLKSYNSLSYVILRSKDLYTKIEKSGNAKALESLGGFMTMAGNIRDGKYEVRTSGKKSYPSTICYDTPERTKEHFLELLKPIYDLAVNQK